MDKQTLRRQILKQRAELSEAQQARDSSKWCVKALEFLADKSFQTIAAYRPIRNELNVLPLLEELRAQGKVILLPRMNVTNRQLTFHEYENDESLELGPYSVFQPKLEQKTHVVDVMLLPLVAGDAKGNRLGYGGGYYDRTLEKASPKPLTIGCGYNFQRVENVPIELHDLPLDALLTA